MDGQSRANQLAGLQVEHDKLQNGLQMRNAYGDAYAEKPSTASNPTQRRGSADPPTRLRDQYQEVAQGKLMFLLDFESCSKLFLRRTFDWSFKFER